MHTPRLFIAIALIASSLSLSAVSFADDSANQTADIFSANALSDATASYDKLIELAYQIQRNATLYKSLNQLLSNYTNIPANLQQEFSWPAKAPGLSTTQLVLILKNVPQLQQLASTYLAAVGQNNGTTTQALQAVNNQTKVILQNPDVVATLTRLADPTQPLAMIQADGSPGYKMLGTYVSHPRLANPNDPNSAVIPADNLVEQWVDFINGAESELWINSYEFSHPALAEAVVRAIARGIKVRVGIDKNTLEHTEYNKQVWQLFSAINDPKVVLTGNNVALQSLVSSIKNPDFILTAVDPLYINHQKIASRDPDTANAGALISSGNLTPDCLDPRGAAFDQPTNHLIDADGPNANHLIVVSGQYPAMIIRAELKKTIIDKLRGSEYPISGSYIIYGEQKPGMSKPPYMMMTFSPNGGLGSINRDIFGRLILATSGPVIAAQYAFASETTLNALYLRAKREKAAGRTVDFSVIGETDFLMQPYSSALALAGYKFDSKTGIYSDDPNAAIKSILSQDEIQALRAKIQIPPPEYGETFVKLPSGKSFKIDRILHHKLWLFPVPHISTPGTSFNTSAAAEGNQEQIIVTNEPETFNILYGAVSYLQKKSAHNVVVEATDRNNARTAKDALPPKPAKKIKGATDSAASAKTPTQDEQKDIKPDSDKISEDGNSPRSPPETTQFQARKIVFRRVQLAPAFSGSINHFETSTCRALFIGQ